MELLLLELVKKILLLLTTSDFARQLMVAAFYNVEKTKISIDALHNIAYNEDN